MLYWVGLAANTTFSYAGKL